MRLSWFNLKEQFGAEYTNSSDFKRAFRNALRQVRAVYPDARVAEVRGGLTIFPSRALLAMTRVNVPTVGSLFQLVDK